MGDSRFSLLAVMRIVLWRGAEVFICLIVIAVKYFKRKKGKGSYSHQDTVQGNKLSGVGIANIQTSSKVRELGCHSCVECNTMRYFGQTQQGLCSANRFFAGSILAQSARTLKHYALDTQILHPTLSICAVVTVLVASLFMDLSYDGFMSSYYTLFDFNNCHRHKFINS